MNLRNVRRAVLLLTQKLITAVSQTKSETDDLQSESRRRGTTKHLHSRLSLRLLFSLLALLALGFGDMANKRANHPASRSGEPDAAVKQRISTAYGRMPLWFEKNEGQTDSRVEFVSRGPGYTLFLSAGGEATLALSEPASDREDTLDSSRPVKVAMAGVTLPDTPSNDRTLRRDTGAALLVKPVGANKKTRAEGNAQLPGTVNYLRGSDQTKWRTGISTYARVSYENVYPGVDLVYYGNQRQLEYDFIVHPGADPRVIGLDFQGADGLTVDSDGDLLVQIAGREVRQRRPLIYQEEGGVRHEIDGRYTLTGKRTVSFWLSAYDNARPLVIDPVLEYSTYLGGIGNESGHSIAVDASGNAYVTGSTRSSNFPTTLGAFDTTFVGLDDVFVTKLDPTGSMLAYSTYLGGSGIDVGGGVAVDASGSAYVTGLTTSPNFPTTTGAFDTTFNGDIDAFVTKLDPTGSMLAYSTYLGGSGADNFPVLPFDSDPIGRIIAVDAFGSAYVTGSTGSANFPTTLGAFDMTFNGGSRDAFVTKLDPTGSMLIYSTYLGGSITDQGQGIAVDGSGSAYMTGLTNSPNFPTTLGSFDTTLDGGLDAFVTKLDPTGSMLAYSTYLGGSGIEQGRGIAVDASGSAYVTGYTDSANFPTTPDAFDMTFNGGGVDTFVTKLDTTGSMLTFSTYLGGISFDIPHAIAVDPSGNAYVTGSTAGTLNLFPTTPGAFDTLPNGSQFDAFVAKFLLGTANTTPTITATVGVTRQQAAGVSNSIIAMVSDTEDAETALAVTVNGSLSATANGVSVSNIAINSGGQVTANISAACGATGASFTLRVTDTGSLFANATLNVAVTLETTPPVINPISNVVVSLPLNSTATSMPVTFPLPTATDNCSAATVVTSPVSGAVFGVGATTVDVTATDGIGNAATSSFTVTVLYNFAGFFEPVNNPPTFNGAKAGQAIPVKFSLSGNKGPNIFAAGFPTSVAIPCPSGSGAPIEETLAASGSFLQYDSGADRYNYVWKTDASWAGTCRQLIVMLNDGTTYTANFQFR